MGNRKIKLSEGRAITVAVIIISFLFFSTVMVSAQDSTQREIHSYVTLSDGTKIDITIRNLNSIEFIIKNLFASFSDTEVYAGEQFDLLDSWSLGSGQCSVESWVLKLERNLPSYKLIDTMDVTSLADKISTNPCKFEVSIGYSTDELGTYSVTGTFKQTGQSSIEIFGSNTVKVIARPPEAPKCAWEDWAYFQSISGGEIYRKQYKDLDVADGVSCNQPSQYKTYCNSGYHITGTASNTIANGVTSCVSNSGGETCTATWTTGEYGPCINGLQQRTVTKTNNCADESNKPDYGRICTSTTATCWNKISISSCQSIDVPITDTCAAHSYYDSELDCVSAINTIGCWERPTSGLTCQIRQIDASQTCAQNGYYDTEFECDGTNALSDEIIPLGGSCTEITASNCIMGSYCKITIGLFGGKSGVCTKNRDVSKVAFSELKKISLTKDKISTSTNDQLLASACLTDGECLLDPNNANYSVSCIKISALRKDGTLTETQSTTFFGRANEIMNGAIKGAGWGAAVGGLTCGGAIVLAATGSTLSGFLATPIAAASATAICTTVLPGSIYVGAVAGGSLAGTIKASDPLVKKLQAKDADSVGICTASPSSSLDLTSWVQKAALFNLTGNKTVDGFIIILAGVFILYLFLSIGGKK